MNPESTPSSQASTPTYRQARSSKALFYLLLLLLGISAGTATVAWMQYNSVEKLLARRAAAPVRRGGGVGGPTAAINPARGIPGVAAPRGNPRGARGARGANGAITRIIASVPDLTPDQTTKLTDLYTQRQQAVTAGVDPAEIDNQISALVGPDDFAIIQPMLNAPARGRRGRGGGGG